MLRWTINSVPIAELWRKYEQEQARDGDQYKEHDEGKIHSRLALIDDLSIAPFHQYEKTDRSNSQADSPDRAKDHRETCVRWWAVLTKNEVVDRAESGGDKAGEEPIKRQVVQPAERLRTGFTGQTAAVSIIIQILERENVFRCLEECPGD